MKSPIKSPSKSEHGENREKRRERSEFSVGIVRRGE
jgi:hypothetical protein